ncbi:MAG TPA: hypothetical protein VEQ60_14185, partial [Longimicrobium sp.]|nr:hypothetical protein [Longimicrobium sp.]
VILREAPLHNLLLRKQLRADRRTLPAEPRGWIRALEPAPQGRNKVHRSRASDGETSGYARRSLRMTELFRSGHPSPSQSILKSVPHVTPCAIL